MSLAADIASDEEAEDREEASDDEEAGDGDADMEGGDGTASILGGGGASDGDDDAEGEADGEDDSDADGDERDTSAFKGRGKGDKATGTKKSSKQAKNQKTEDMFFDADDMEKFADEGTMDDDDLEDGVLDEMYGGGGGDADSGEEKDQEDDSDEEDDAEMMEELMQDEAESGDEQVGGGIKHEDFFDDGDDGAKPTSKRRLSKKKQSSRRQQQEEEGDAESDGDDVDDEGDEHASNDEGEEEEEEEEEAGVLSAHVHHSRRMKSKISDQERELLAEKPWALRGEVHSHDRPQNSLLEATVDVERATRVAPPPTAEHAMTLLDMIKKRCLDGNWDDVTPRDLQGPTVRKEAPHLSQDKSKEGLGELYEKEFLKKTMGVTEDDPQKGLKNELKHLFSKLCGKLDALCNFHYTPKAAIPEMKVQADVAAIAMEEVLPSSVADAEALAPEELYKKKRGREAEFLEGGAEMSQEDRKRSRSSKKAVRRKARRQAQAAQKLVSKLNPGLGNKYEKAKMMRDIQGAKNVTTAPEESTGREFSTSAKFFSQLQESVTASVKSAGKGLEGDAKDTKKAAQLRL
ncbi:unnamed protein product [Ectocarpus sp. 12 AP-2014]